MKLTTLQILSIAVLILGISISLVYLNSRDTIRYPLTFEISDSAGFDLNSSALTFGKIIPGSNAVRYVSIENNNVHKVYVEITSSKNILPFLKVSENEFFLLPRENKTLEFVISVPKNSSKAVYYGDVFIKIVEKSDD